MRPPRPSIVCCSPDEGLRDALGLALENAGFPVVVAPGGEAALPGLDADVAVLDARVAGRELLQTLRAQSARTAVLVIGETNEAALADRVLPALADPEALLAALRALVRIAQADHSVRDLSRRWLPGLDALRDGMCLRDADEVVVRCNRAFAEALGSTPLAAAGRRIRTGDLFDDAVLPADVAVRNRWFRASVETLHTADGGIAGSMLVLADLPERTLVERERGQAERLARDLENARAEFLSVASHELRTPLTTVQLQVQALQRWVERGDRPLDPQTVRDKLSKAEREVRRLVRLVAEMLDAAMLEHCRIEFHEEETDLSAVVRDVVQRQAERILASGSRVTVNVKERVTGMWDRGRVDQVVNNLLANALLYGRGRPIEIKARISDGVARLQVRDEGVGIAAEDQRRIFKRFERAVNDRSLPGFGIGLWSVRRILEAMGGCVSVESEPGIGSTFTVELPLASAETIAGNVSRA